MRHRYWMLMALLLPSLAWPAVEVRASSEIVVEVKGVVCSFCAYGARKNLERVEFLDRTQFKEGVLMETEKGAITLATQQGKPIDFVKIHNAIQNGGYEILAVHVNLHGVVEVRNGVTTLRQRHNGQEFHLLGADGKAWDPHALRGKPISVQAVIPASVLLAQNSAAITPVNVKTAGAPNETGATHKPIGSD